MYVGEGGDFVACQYLYRERCGSWREGEREGGGKKRERGKCGEGAYPQCQLNKSLLHCE